MIHGLLMLLFDIANSSGKDKQIIEIISLFDKIHYLPVVTSKHGHYYFIKRLSEVMVVRMLYILCHTSNTGIYIYSVIRAILVI